MKLSEAAKTFAHRFARWRTPPAAATESSCHAASKATSNPPMATTIAVTKPDRQISNLGVGLGSTQPLYSEQSRPG